MKLFRSISCRVLVACTCWLGALCFIAGAQVTAIIAEEDLEVKVEETVRVADVYEKTYDAVGYFTAYIFLPWFYTTFFKTSDSGRATKQHNDHASVAHGIYYSIV